MNAINNIDPDFETDPDRTSNRTRTSLPLEGETRGPGGFVRVALACGERWENE